MIYGEFLFLKYVWKAWVSRWGQNTLHKHERFNIEVFPKHDDNNKKKRVHTYFGQPIYISNINLFNEIAFVQSVHI